jgi:hypothetical protein
MNREPGSLKEGHEKLAEDGLGASPRMDLYPLGSDGCTR